MCKILPSVIFGGLQIKNQETFSFHCQKAIKVGCVESICNGLFYSTSTRYFLSFLRLCKGNAFFYYVNIIKNLNYYKRL